MSITVPGPDSPAQRYLRIVRDPEAGRREADLALQDLRRLLGLGAVEEGPLWAAVVRAYSEDDDVKRCWIGREWRENLQIFYGVVLQQFEALLPEIDLNSDVGDDSTTSPLSMLASHIHAMGEVGAQFATVVRDQTPCADSASAEAEGPGKHWLWFADLDGAGPPFIHPLVRAIWLDVVKPRLMKNDGSNTETVPKSIAPGIASERGMNALVGVGSSRTSLTGRGDGSRDIVILGGRKIGVIGPTDEVPVVPSGITDLFTCLRKLSWHRLLRLLVRRGFEQKFVELRPDPGLIVFEGGWQEIAHLAGAASNKAQVEMRKAAEALRLARIEGPLGRGGLLSYWESPAQRGRRARVEFSLCGPLRPGFIDELRHQRPGAQPPDRWIVPVPATLPPLDGGPRTHPAQAALQLRVMLELRRKADEYHSSGAVGISDSTWREMGAFVGIDDTIKLHRVLDVWQRGDDDDEPFILRSDGGRWKLAPSYSREERAIMDGGRRTIQGRRAASRRKPR